MYTAKIRKKIAESVIKFEHCGFTYREMHQKNANGMANSEDPDQTVPDPGARVLLVSQPRHIYLKELDMLTHNTCQQKRNISWKKERKNLLFATF